MNDAYDSVVIGAGHNGLVTAAYLARAGRRVLVLESRSEVGGALATREVFPGFKYETGAHGLHRLHPTVVAELKLVDHGLELMPCDPCVFAPVPGGGGLTLWRDTARSAEEIRPFSVDDAKRWADFTRLIVMAGSFLDSIYVRPPNDPMQGGASAALERVRLAMQLRRLGRRDMMRFVRVLPMSIVELMDDWFEADILRGTIGALGITGMKQGPMAAGTAFQLLHQHASHEPVTRGLLRPRGGMGSLARALRAAAEAEGVEIRTGARVARVLVEDGRAVGAALENGDEIRAERVVSNADPKRTLLELLDPLQLEPEFSRHARNIQCQGVCARVNLALGELPAFTGAPNGDAHLRGSISVSPDLPYLERAFDDAKYGQISRHPYLEAIIPSLADPTLAPTGQHVMSILVQYAPLQLRDGEWNAAMRDTLGDRVVATLAGYAPNLPQAILHRQVLTPLDIEAEFGLTGGDIYHGQMTLNQLYFARPVPGWSRYRTPIPGLYLCGAGTHPGGGVTAMPGYLAASQILSEPKEKR